MDREYDLFEKLPDGALLWRIAVTGRDTAVHIMAQLAQSSGNEVLVMYLPTHTVVATSKKDPPAQLAKS